MTFLPIAERELRVAARKRSTFWLRVVAALIGLVIGSACMMLAAIGGFPTPGFGAVLFGILTWLGLAAALVAGLFFTSDSLSEEKREGTLGFLFLTDLRGYDVVAGKLLATSLRGFFALLALVPILAITLLMGGVTGMQFWKTSLALLNALFCSLAVGLFVSTVSHDSQKAMAGTFVLLCVFIVAGPLTDSIYGHIHGRGFVPYVSLSSPGYLFSTAKSWGRSPFWLSLLLTQAIAWLLFGLASVLIPRTWQQKESKTLASTRGWVYAWKYGGPMRRAAIRRKLLDRDAIIWLVCRERWQSLGIWTITLLLIAGFITFAAILPETAWTAWKFLGGLFLFAFYLWAASQSCRFFVEARRSGLTELLLAAPLTEGQVVRGHCRGLARMYGIPVLLLLCLNLAAFALSQNAWTVLTSSVTTGRIPAASAPVGSNATGSTVATNTQGIVVIQTSIGTNTVRRSFVARTLSKTPQLVIMVTTVVAEALTTTANILALSWFGMWMGLTSRNANLATLKTLSFVYIIPALVILFASYMVVALLLMPFLIKASSNSSGTSTMWMMIWPLATTGTACALSLAKDMVFILWARKKLYGSFRDQASRSFDQSRPTTPPAVPPPAQTPPSIASPLEPTTLAAS